ncbi:MAG: S-layer homology domain-containing protein [Firmicutes bacterium]|nr:S-layer homology domain-containing protein [Bacillota bacterium]
MKKSVVSRKLFCVLLALFLLFGLTPSLALAADPAYTVGTAAELYQAAAQINANNYTATVTLSADITLNNYELKFTAGNTTLVGQGYTLYMDNQHSRGIHLTDNAVLNLCLPDQSDTLTLSNGSINNNLTEAIITLNKNARLNIYAGAVICESRSAATPAGIELLGNAALHMYGGTLRNLKSQPIAGGVWVSENSVFTMDAGVIENCSCYGIPFNPEYYFDYGNCTGGGGGVTVTGNGVMTMNGGVIRNCQSQQASGGGVFLMNFYTDADLLSPVFTMNGGAISGCSAKETGGGLGVFQKGNARVSIGKDAEITGNRATSYGGGVMFFQEAGDQNGGALTIADGAKIHNNTADAAGDDILLWKGTMHLGAVGSGLVLTADEKPIDGWYDDGNNDGEDGKPIRYSEENMTLIEPGDFTETIVLKAAHGSNLTVSFDKNGGEGEMEPQTITGGVPTALSANTFTRAHYQFAGWNTKADGSGTAYADGEEVSLSPAGPGPVVLYAQWAAEITVAISGSTASRVYNGTVQSNSDYAVTCTIGGEAADTGSLPQGITLSYSAVQDGEEAGTVAACGKDVGVYTATVTAALSGSAQGYVIQTASASADVVLHITPATLTVTTKSAKQRYTGLPLTAPGAIEGFVSVDGMAETATFIVTGSQTDVGKSDNTYRIIWNGTAKAQNYTITEDVGRLIVVESSSAHSHSPAGPQPAPVPPDLDADKHIAYICGYPDGSVRPQADITRAEVATVFYRLLQDDARRANDTDANGFRDVNPDQWFNRAVSTLAAMGLITGYPDGTFRPDAAITRAEFTAIAARFDGKTGGPAADFPDTATHWAAAEIAKAAANGWINGYPDGTFRPDRRITRAEAMAFVNRMLHRNPASPEDLLDGMLRWPDNRDTGKWFYLDVQEAGNSHTYTHTANGTEKWLALENAAGSQ